MNRSRAGAAGLVAAVVAVGVTEFVAGLLPGGGSVFVAVANGVIEATPGPIVRFAIETFASANRLVLLLSMTAVIIAAGILLGIATVRRAWVGLAGMLVFAGLGTTAGLADVSVAASTAVLAPLVGAVVGSVVLERLVSRLREDPARPAADGVRDTNSDTSATHDDGAVAVATDRDQSSRRQFLTWSATAAGAGVALLTAGRFLQQRSATATARVATELPVPRGALPSAPAGASLDVEGLSELFTPNDEFYRIDTAFTIPQVDPSTHAVRFTGMVDQPFEITFDELLDLADTEVDVTLSCVSNEVGGDLIGNARWLGVPLADLLDRAGVQPGADQIVGRSVDGWTSGFPVDVAFDGRPAIMAVGMNGEPLPPRHGFPVRLVIAGLYGYVSDTKWLSEIELTTFDAFDAYWVPRGWSAMGPIKTQSRIDVPRARTTVEAGTVAVAGVAWSDGRGVSAVEVSVDDGPWQPAELAAELATTTWRQWLYRWGASPGNHVLRVRASDRDGVPQTADVAPPAPNGATGYHTVAVTVA